MSYQVKISIPPALFLLLQELTNQELIMQALEAAGLYLKGKFAKYPPRNVSRVGVPMLRTDKQRRYFFYALKNNLIDVPYRRGMSPSSQRLSQRWDVQRHGLSVEIGTNVTYAPYVVGERQAFYHKVTGWKTVDDIARAEEKNVQRQFELALKQRIAKAGG